MELRELLESVVNYKELALESGDEQELNAYLLKGIKLIEEHEALYPEDETILKLAGILYYHSRFDDHQTRHKMVIDYLNKSLEIRDDKETVLFLGYEYFDSGDYTRACNHFRSAMKLGILENANIWFLCKFKELILCCHLYTINTFENFVELDEVLDLYEQHVAEDLPIPVELIKAVTSIELKLNLHYYKRLLAIIKKLDIEELFEDEIHFLTSI